MNYCLPGYDEWKTRTPDDNWGVCPECGASQEDCTESGDTWTCSCGVQFTEEEARYDPRGDEPADFDERRWSDD